jgi:uncharacterized membrane protein
VRRTSAAAAVVLGLAQIAYPLTRHKAGVSTIVVVALAVCAVSLAISTWGAVRAGAAALVVTAGSAGFEILGVRTGWPFGRYHYHGILRPTVASVPLIVPLAWLGMGLAAWAVAGRLAATSSGRVGVGAVALTGWDLFLDPQMTHQRFWTWTGGGFYRGIPLSNYGGWLVGSGLVMVVFAALLDPPGSWGLVGLYTWMAWMETVGFVAFFGDPLVGLVGGVVMIPLAAAAWLTSP